MSVSTGYFKSNKLLPIRIEALNKEYIISWPSTAVSLALRGEAERLCEPMEFEDVIERQKAFIDYINKVIPNIPVEDLKQTPADELMGLFLAAQALAEGFYLDFQSKYKGMAAKMNGESSEEVMAAPAVDEEELKKK